MVPWETSHNISSVKRIKVHRSRNIQNKIVVVISEWEVISDETAIYFNYIYFLNFLQACFTFMFKKKSCKSYKT